LPARTSSEIRRAAGARLAEHGLDQHAPDPEATALGVDGDVQQMYLVATRQVQL
jgi:hypothetical protein